VGALLAVGEVFPSAVGMVEHSHDAHDGKAATGLLTCRLGIFHLVLLGVVERHGAAVDGFDDVAVVGVLRPDPSTHIGVDPLADRGEELGPQASACFTVSTDPVLLACLDQIVLVDRLREVVAQVGVTRFESRGTTLDGELDLQLQPAPLAKDKIKIIPAFENRGEGIFLQFTAARISEWSEKSSVQNRSEDLKAGFALKAEERGQDDYKFHGAPFYMLHTLAHLLIQEITLECGYPSSSLKERIYCDASAGEFGILIYTGSSDAEGTLGGLVNAADRIRAILLNTIQNASICSADPVCSHTKPEKDNPSHWLQGSACHCCTHLPETSCEQMNQYLDRSLVVTTLEGLGCEFFNLTGT